VTSKNQRKKLLSLVLQRSEKRTVVLGRTRIFGPKSYILKNKNGTKKFNLAKKVLEYSLKQYFKIV